jgi:N-acetylglucosamine kinase-like BadF-type ATPase
VDLLVGVDVGGTKLAVRAETLSGEPVADVTLVASGWSATPAGSAAAWLVSQLSRCLPAGGRVVAAGVGAQGCDSARIGEDLRLALAALGVSAIVVNDGALLVPAAGLDAGIGIVAGTGSIAVGTGASGEVLLAGGWGWVLGDEGGAAAVVREATRAALRAHDEGKPDDGLLGALLEAFGLACESACGLACGGGTVERLARLVNDEPTVENWAPRAPAVFAAASAGSGRAAAVIEAAATELAALAGRLRARGAVGTVVVAGGGVVTRQPLLARALAEALRRVDPVLELRVLAGEPVAGAVVLARRMLGSGLGL